MKTLKDWKKEVDSTLKTKVSEALKAFQSQREKDIEELVTLGEQLEKYEGEKKKLIDTQEAETKNFIPSQKVLNEVALKLQHFDKLIREKKKAIDFLFAKLTTLPEFMKDYPFLKMIQG